MEKFRNKVCLSISCDLRIVTLESLVNIMLALGQECFWSKAIEDKLSSTIISKMAMSTSKYYAKALETITTTEYFTKIFENEVQYCLFTLLN